MLWLSKKSEMKLHWTVTVTLYGLTIVGLVPFSHQIRTSFKNSGKICIVRGFRFSKIGTVYNILFFIVLQVAITRILPNYAPGIGFLDTSPSSIGIFVDIALTCLVVNIITIHSSFRQKNAVSFMTKLLEVECLLSDFEKQPLQSNKGIFTSLPKHLLVSLFLWVSNCIARALQLFDVSGWILYSVTSFAVYCLIFGYSIVLGLVGNQLERANKDLLKLKELPYNTSPNTFSNDLPPDLSISTKTHIANVKILLKIRTMLYEVSRDLEEFFSFLILIATGCFVFRLLFHVYFLILLIPKLNHWLIQARLVSMLSSILVISYSMTFLSMNVEKALKEAKLTGSVIHKLLAAPTMREIRVELRRFSLQLLHERFAFTGYGLFKLDGTMLHSVSEATVVYLIVFVQLWNL